MAEVKRHRWLFLIKDFENGWSCPCTLGKSLRLPGGCVRREPNECGSKSIRHQDPKRTQEWSSDHSGRPDLPDMVVKGSQVDVCNSQADR